MIELIDASMDYSKQIEFGIFTIGFVCLLILINIIRWIYAIYLYVQRSMSQKKQAKVSDKQLELHESNISE